jgi:hypothetical protein
LLLTVIEKEPEAVTARLPLSWHKKRSAARTSSG